MKTITLKDYEKDYPKEYNIISQLYENQKINAREFMGVLEFLTDYELFNYELFNEDDIIIIYYIHSEIMDLKEDLEMKFSNKIIDEFVKKAEKVKILETHKIISKYDNEYITKFNFKNI